MRQLRYFIPFLLLLFASDAAFAQFRDRDQDRDRDRPSRRERSSSRRTQTSTGDASLQAIVDRSWAGASASLSFYGNGNYNSTVLGIAPMVGYKFTPWLSAGPRLSVLYNGVKVTTSSRSRQRFNLWDFGGGAFARAKVYMFYAQAELMAFSREEPIDLNDGATERVGDQEFLVGIGYNPGGGSLGSDIGIFYNLFDSVDSQRSAIQFRIMLTFGY